MKEEYVQAGFEGRRATDMKERRNLADWVVMTVVVIIFCSLAWYARAPQISVDWPLAIALAVVLLAILAYCGLRLRRVTSFN
jgi:CHASE2 domain-containing sensor protein